MNRDYMLAKINRRLYDLELQYNQLDEARYTKKSAGVMRTRLKRDICILTLLYEVVYACREVNITNEDAILGFEKLVKFV